MPNIPSTTPHSRRSTGIRRPRVAGRAPAATSPEEVPTPGTEDVHEHASSVDTLDAGEHAPDTDVPAEPVDLKKNPAGEDAAARPTGKRMLGKRLLGRRGGPSAVRSSRRRSVPTAVLAGLLVVLTAAAVFFGIGNAELRGTPAAQNTALVDVGTTAQVSQQLGDALKTVYSYDFTRLDQNEAASRAVITPEFKVQFDQLFGQVRKIAPQQKAVVTATVASSAVREIVGNRAVLVVFLDQQVTRAQADNKPQQLAAAGRLTVTGQLVDGVWKIADVQAQ